MSAIFNFEALLLVLLLMICTATYLKDQPLVGPKMEANKFGVQDSSVTWNSLWKLSRIGERLSPYVSLCCICFGVYVLLIR